MIKDLSQFVSDLSDMQLPAYDQSSNDFMSRLKSFYSTLKQVSNNYSQAYIANRMYHYNENQQFQDDTTDAMSAPATAVLENAVSQLRSQWDALSHGKSGTTIDILEGGTGSKPQLEAPQFFELNVIEGTPDRFTFDSQYLRAAGNLDQLIDFDASSQANVLLPWKFNGYSCTWSINVSNIEDDQYQVSIDIRFFTDPSDSYGSTWSITVTRATTAQEFFENFDGDHTLSYMSSLASNPVAINLFGDSYQFASDTCYTRALENMFKNSDTTDWSNCNPTGGEMDLFEIIISKYPDPTSLIEDLESLL